MTFKEKVQSMSAKDIILAMVRGLENKHLEIDMTDYGYSKEGVCFGCAATNTLCEISKKKFTADVIDSGIERAHFLKADFQFINKFEIAINQLRQGRIENYNSWVKDIAIAPIDDTLEIHGCSEAILDDDYTQEQLDIYRLLAFSQPE